MTQQYVSRGFWKAYNSSRCKTVMMVISIMITFGFVINQMFGDQNMTLANSFFAVMAYWVGRNSKTKEIEQ